ncbi:MAG TPA: hypothetical protein VG605_17165 [Puia sp.]|nr:hypothetical protein [Puia sp.]
MSFSINFEYKPDGVRGTAEIEPRRVGDEVWYIASNIRLFNTAEELLDAGMVYEQELAIKQTLDADTGITDWVDAETEEESELAEALGAAISRESRNADR